MLQLPRHAQYKKSGLPWVGEIPAHWQTRRNRFLFREVDRRSKHGEETHLSMSQVHGLVPSKDLGRKSLQSENYAGGKLVAEHDLVLNRLKAHLGVFARAKQAGVVSPDYTVLRPKGDASVRYCESLFKTPMYVGEFRRRTKGIVEGFWRLYTDDFYNVTALLPPPEEQDQIVAYLRAQDAHIARFIKAKRDLIKLLIEQKLRIIDHAVTRGLDASVALKPSGIEWLGEVPEHWEVQRLKNVADVVLGKMLTTEAKGGEGDFKPYLRSTNVQWIKPDVRDVKEMWIAKAEMAQLRVRKGDLLVSEGGEVGRACMWNDELPECYIQNSVHRVAAKPTMLPEFLFHQFFAYGKRGRFNAIVNRVSIAHLTREKLVTIPFTVPPVEEQQSICRWITDECQPLDDAIARTEEEIKLIREYRDRQIVDVVTGQVDVRGWQPGPDDAVDDAALAALGDDQEDVTEEEEGDGED
jgi:type I restriction enzyme S subunit